MSKRRIREFINEVMVAYEEWVKEVLPNLPKEDPVIEGTLHTLVGQTDNGKDVDLTGTPDAVYPMAGIIVDWKTAGRNWDANKMQGQIQPWAYSLMVEWNMGIEVLEFQFYVYDRSTESWWLHRHMLADKEKAQEALKHQAIAFAEMVEVGMPVYTPSGSGWKPRGWHCSPKYCQQWEACKGKYLVADGAANQPPFKEEGWK
jgi:hypothetical protein